MIPEFRKTRIMLADLEAQVEDLINQANQIRDQYNTLLVQYNNITSENIALKEQIKNSNQQEESK